jgi:NitT/TauT family transport system substrate-binding protein
VERFLRAFRKGAHDYHDAFTGLSEKRVDGSTAPEILAIIAKYTGQPEAAIRSAIGYVDSDARVDVKDIKHQIAWFQSQGMVKSDVTGDAIIDARYAVPLPARPATH